MPFLQEFRSRIGELGWVEGHNASLGRMGWQEVTGYGRRALVETAMGRYKGIIGARLRARGEAAQRTEAIVGVAVLNRMLDAGRPNSVRRQASAA